jgi:hypothetical protein
MTEEPMTWDGILNLLDMVKRKDNRKEIREIKKKVKQLKKDGLTPDTCLLTMSGLMVYVMGEAIKGWDA